MHTRPYRPQGRGKQEKFFRFVDLSFVPEAYDLIEQGKIQTLEDLNRFFTAWLEVAYHQKVHNSFKQRPADRYHKCESPIRHIPPHQLVEIFLMEETRVVDKTNCVSLLGTFYEVKGVMAGEKVDLRFDPYDMSAVQVWKDGKRLEDAKKMEKLSWDRAKQKGLEQEPKSKSQPTPKTGLNFVELAYTEYLAQQKKKTEHGFSELFEGSVHND